MMRSTLSLVVFAILLSTTPCWGPKSEVSAFRPSTIQSCHHHHIWSESPPKLQHQEQRSTTPNPWIPSSRGLYAAGATDNDAMFNAAFATAPSTATPGGPFPSREPPVTTSIVKDCVFKFGGSSLANAERIDHVANLIKDQIEDGFRPRAVVCSAMGKTTNALLQAGQEALAGTTMTPTGGRGSLDGIRALHHETLRELNLLDGSSKCSVLQDVDILLQECHELLTGVQLLEELSPRSKDQLVSYGERCAVRILAARLNQIGIPAQAYDAWEVGVFTMRNPAAASEESNNCDAQLVPDYAERIQCAFKQRVVDPNIVAVVTGFIAKEEVVEDDTIDYERETFGKKPSCGSKITTLGRGGSDLTATAIGSALSVDEIIVWKDVDGILTTDPRVVPKAIPLAEITYEEASELAHFGAKVLHPIAMEPCREHHIPVRVKNSYNPTMAGTLIHGKRMDLKKDHALNYNNSRLVTAITCKRDIRLLDIHSTQMMGTYGFLSKVFSEFDKHQVSVDVLASSEVSVSLTLDKNQQGDACIESLIYDLDQDPAIEVTFKDGMSILTLITNVEQSSEVLATVFRVFAQQKIRVEMMSQGASKVNISCVIATAHLDLAIRYLHDCFFGDQCVVDSGLLFPREDDEEEEDESDVVELFGEIHSAILDVDVPGSLPASVCNSSILVPSW